MTPTSDTLRAALAEMREYGDMLVGIIGALPAECRQNEDGDTCELHNAEWSTRNEADLGHCEWIEARMEAIPGWRAAERQASAVLQGDADAPDPLTPERLAAIGKVSYEPTRDPLAIKGRIARGAADYEGFLMAMSPYIRVEESVREAHAGSRSADSSTTPDADAPVDDHLSDFPGDAFAARDARLAAATSSADAGAGGLTTAKGPVEGWRWVAVLRALHAAGIAYETLPDGIRAALAAGAAVPAARLQAADERGGAAPSPETPEP